MNSGFWVIALTFLVALMLSAVPLPEWIQWGWPKWVAMVLIYWVIALPHRVGVSVGWIIGLFLDILQGSLLGQNALALSLVAYLAHSLHQRLRMYSVLQQSAMVLVLLGINQLICYWIQGLVGVRAQTLWFLLPTVVSTLLWPGMFGTLRGLRRQFNVR